VTEVWSKADLHIHTDHSDGLASVQEVMEYVAAKTDLSVIAVTDHNTIEGALFAKSLEELYDFEVIVGEEVTSTAGHIIGLFLTETVPPGMSGEDTVAAIRAQGGIAIVPHPFANRAFGPFGLKALGEQVHELDYDGVEVYNSSPYLYLANRLAAKELAGKGAAATGGSDAHVLRAIGTGYTRFPGRTADDLRRAIEDASTSAHAGTGHVSVALRYMVRYPRIRRLQAWNWERCKP
jgi:predicted metal-dependent phosphoesterase TrpH